MIGIESKKKEKINTLTNVIKKYKYLIDSFSTVDHWYKIFINITIVLKIFRYPVVEALLGVAQQRVISKVVP